MDSKIEYSRCLLPKMSIKLGNKSQKEYLLITKEKRNIREKMQLLFKTENKRSAESDQKQRKRTRTEIPELDLDAKNEPQH